MVTKLVIIFTFIDFIPGQPSIYAYIRIQFLLIQVNPDIPLGHNDPFVSRLRVNGVSLTVHKSDQIKRTLRASDSFSVRVQLRSL